MKQEPEEQFFEKAKTVAKQIDNGTYSKELSDEEMWQKGFAEGKSSGISQFIRDECDKKIVKQLSDEEITDVFVECLLPDGEFNEHEFARAILKKASEK